MSVRLGRRHLRCGSPWVDVINPQREPVMYIVEGWDRKRGKRHKQLKLDINYG